MSGYKQLALHEKASRRLERRAFTIGAVVACAYAAATFFSVEYLHSLGNATHAVHGEEERAVSQSIKLFLSSLQT